MIMLLTYNCWSCAAIGETQTQI